MIRQARSRGPSAGSPAQVVRRFIAAVNRHDVDALTELMAEDYLFVDSLGHQIRGRQANRRAWIGYFAMVQDYRVVVRETLVSGRTVVVLGTASGTYVSPLNHMERGTWEVPAAWRAAIRRGRVAEWQVYADNEPIRALMRTDSTSR